MKRTVLVALVLLEGALAARAKPLRLDGERLLPLSSSWAKKERFKAERPKFRRDREADILHIRLEIAPDFEKQAIEASVVHRFKVLSPELDRLELDAKELDIKKVADDKGKTLDFEVLAGKLIIHFSKTLRAGQEASVRVDYSATPRRMGLHFFKVDSRYPGQPDMVWSQGEAEENSYWIPLYDYPNERSSSEVVATVPEGFTAISNGKLVSKVPGSRPGTLVYHWLQERAHVGYLIALYVARYVPVEFKATVKEGAATREVPMTAWVLPGQEEMARITFKKTPAMVEYFSDLLDTPYPWVKYDQIILYQFFGGMENTSATSILDRALLDKRAAIDGDSDGLISHELAHQWFGNLVTCKDWSHIWLNEGITSYFQALWKLKDEGADEFAVDMYKKAQDYFGETGSYNRPVVTDRYEDPDDMFDDHTYEKGAWVLHMLRKELGDERFWKAFKLYLRDHQDKVAETEDLRRAVEETTGKSMVEFFAQWLYSPGFPSLKLKADWDPSEKKLKLVVTQKQVKDGLPVFHFKLPLELGGKKVEAEVSKEEETFSWDLSSRPKMIRVDPEMTVLAGYDFDFPEDVLLEGLRKDPSAVGRIRAAKTLAGKPNSKVIAALRECLLKDPFWAVQGACAQQLGDEIGGPKALAALKDGLSVKNPKARIFVVQELGGFLRQKEAFEALKPVAEKDESWRVEAAALSSLGTLRLPEARPILEGKLTVDSWNEIIRGAALGGLGSLKEESLIPILKEWSEPGKRPLARSGALRGLANAGEGKDEVRDFLQMVLETEEDRVVRRGAISALTTLGDPKANSSLAKVASREPDPGMKRRAEEAIESIREGKKGKIEDLSKQVDDVVKKLELLEKKLEEQDKKKR